VTSSESHRARGPRIVEVLSDVDVNLIDRTASEPEFANKAIDRVLRYARGKILLLPIELIPKRIHR